MAGLKKRVRERRGQLIKFMLEDLTRWKLEHLGRIMVLFGFALALVFGGPSIFPQTLDRQYVTFWVGLGVLILVAWLDPQIESRRRQAWLQQNVDAFAPVLKNAVQSVTEASTFALRLPSGLLRDFIENPDPKARRAAKKRVSIALDHLTKQLKDEGGPQSVAHELIKKAACEDRAACEIIRAIDDQALARSGLFNLYPRLKRWMILHNSMTRKALDLVPSATQEIERGDVSGENVKGLGSEVYSIGLCGLYLADLYSNVLTDAAGGKESGKRSF